MSAVSERAVRAPVQAELLIELRTLQARLPVPQLSWHAHVALIRDCRDDLGHAIDDAAAECRDHPDPAGQVIGPATGV